MKFSFLLLKTFQVLIILVWLLNGLFCKILNLVPRHEEIVRTILQTDHSRILTIMIGFGELSIAAAVIFGFQKRFLTWFQIGLVFLMNILETILVPDLLLWGKLNLVWAILFCVIIYVHYFVISKTTQHST